MSQLGERFCLYRMDVDEADQHARQSLNHIGGAREMRSELREAVQALYAGIPTDQPLPGFAPTDRDRLVALSSLVVRARSGVIRDTYGGREIELVPAAEAPGRLVVQLGLLLIGLRIIGLDDATAWSVVTKTGHDSMPTLRWQTLELLLATHEPTPTTLVATTLDVPTTTARRTLEDLTAHHITVRESVGQGKADVWYVAEWTRAQHAAMGAGS
jgi:hypothetical protein